MEQNYLVIDVGGTAIKYAVMNQDLSISDRGNIKTPYEGVKKYLDTIEGIYRLYETAVCGIAMSVPGIIDTERGVAMTGGALTYINNTPLVSLLSERCKTKVTIENDGKCAALAEAWKGNLSKCKDGIVLLLGTGVGGGIIKDGNLHKGKHFSAGEFSFWILGQDTADDKNLWGSVSGNRYLLKRVAAAINTSIDELDGYKVFDLANQGNQEVLRVLDEFTAVIAKQIFNLQVIYDPERIAIGGGISRQKLLLRLIRKHLDYNYDNFPYDIPHAEVVECKFNNDANLIGALKNFLTYQGGQNDA